jgi:RNA polymerase sigma-70 factor (ECF subfamily)
MSPSNAPKDVVRLDVGRTRELQAERAVQARAVEAALVERCRRGELGGFEELYRQHAPRLFNLANRMLGNSADAEDAVQDTFLLAHRRLDSFRGEAALGTWLYRLMVNHCLDRLRSRSSRDSQATDSLDEPARRWQPTARADATVERMDLKAAIARLAEGARAVFVLHDVEGLEHREIGRILGISEGTSKSQLHKARLRLRELLRRT